MKTLLISGMCILLLGCQSPTPTAKNPEPQTHPEEFEEITTNPIFIGIVEDGVLRLVFPKPTLGGRIRFTNIAMHMSVPPESGELDLSQYEGKAIAIQGHNGGGWIYSAHVVDEGGPIVTALVQQVLDK
jgi:hypothetical protein